MQPAIVPLAEFARTMGQAPERPVWALPQSAPPLSLDRGGVRLRVEDVVDTVVALQRAEWLQDGVYVGPRGGQEVYRDVLRASRRLEVSVPPALLTAGVMKQMQAAGTDVRPFLVLSSYFMQSADPDERRFVIGRLMGHIAASQVTPTSLYRLLVDHGGVRQVARRAVGPVLEVVLAPVGLGLRLALSRWHRAAELTADRAGLLCCGSVEQARRAMLRIALSIQPQVDPEVYLDQLRGSADDASPGRWAELLASEPWMHKRMRHLQLFADSALYSELSGRPTTGLLGRDELERQTSLLLGVS